MSGSFARFAAIRRASSFVNSFAADRRLLLHVDLKFADLVPERRFWSDGISSSGSVAIKTRHLAIAAYLRVFPVERPIKRRQYTLSLLGEYQ
jgi:hypothetical protein